jgi:hypothetical protein
MDRNETLQDALGRASGLDSAEVRAFARAATPADTARVAAASRAAIAGLISLRAAQVDSVLAAPGILLELSARELPSKDFGSCGFDPQNLFQVTATKQLHRRWWRPCSGPALVAELNVPAVHDRGDGTIRAVIGAEADVKITVGGKPVTLAEGETMEAAADLRVEAPRASVQSARATLSRRGIVLRVTPLP